MGFKFSRIQIEHEVVSLKIGLNKLQKLISIARPDLNSGLHLDMS